MKELRLEKVDCNLCGGNQSKLIFRVGQHNVVKCSSCGLAYLNPRPSTEDMTEIYQTSDYYQNKDNQQINPTGYPDYTALEEHLHFVVGELLRPIRGINEGKLLDVGCGMGIMLDRFRELGWDTYGVDVSTYASEYARSRLGLKVYTGTVDQLEFPEGYFDLVTMVLAIEHVPNPKKTLAELSRLIKPGGIIIIATHDISGLWPRIVRHRWRHLNIPEHVYFFSRSTLKRMLEAVGFKVFKTSETATLAAATGGKTGLYAPIRFLHHYHLIGLATPVLRILHTINRNLNFSDGVTLYSRKL